jgi:hypothetical protein
MIDKLLKLLRIDLEGCKCKLAVILWNTVYVDMIGGNMDQTWSVETVIA